MHEDELELDEALVRRLLAEQPSPTTRPKTTQASTTRRRTGWSWSCLSAARDDASDAHWPALASKMEPSPDSHVSGSAVASESWT
jgi:hypothetical protein